MGITFSPNGMFYKYFSFHNNLFKIGWPFINALPETKKKENVDYILSTEDNREVIIFLTVLWNQDYNQRFGWKNLFSSPIGFTYIVFNMERHLARPAFLAVFINQDNQYQQNKLEKNIMIKHKWDVKACFERYNTNEKHKAIILFYFFQCNSSAHEDLFWICFTVRILKYTKID